MTETTDNANICISKLTVLGPEVWFLAASPDKLLVSMRSDEFIRCGLFINKVSGILCLHSCGKLAAITYPWWPISLFQASQISLKDLLALIRHQVHGYAG